VAAIVADDDRDGNAHRGGCRAAGCGDLADVID
jgi:hypothetical protein